MRDSVPGPGREPQRRGPQSHLESFGGLGLAALFSAAPDGILIIDDEGIVVSANEAVRDVFGYDPDDLVGASVTLLMPEPDSHAHDSYLRSYLDTRKPRIVGIGRKVLGRHRDGTAFPLYLSVGEFPHEGHSHFVGICHDATAEQEHIEQIRDLATYDDLTRVLNRRSVVVELTTLLERAEHGDDGVAVLFIDLDDFKQINDRFGHQVGDRVLQIMAARLQAQLRDGDRLARVGDDEFVAVIRTDEDETIPYAVAGRLVATSREPVEVEGTVMRLSASVGISIAPHDGQTADDLINSAGMAMYQAKRARRAAPERFASQLRREAKRSFDLYARLHEALERDEFRLHYQPQVDLISGRICGIEALLRWYDPRCGMRHPDDFLGAARASGILPPLEELVLRTACRHNARLIREGIANLPVAVNITSATFSSMDLVSLISHALDASGLPADRLAIELVEDALIGSDNVARSNAQGLRDIGVALVIDDFGTGHSSLGRLRDHPFAGMKIDRSFVDGLPDVKRDRALTTGILQIAEGLNIQVIAEGVETEAQRDFLVKAGCETAQGWLYAKAMPVDELIDWIAARN